jgi:hypothetical protein
MLFSYAFNTASSSLCLFIMTKSRAAQQQQPERRQNFSTGAQLLMHAMRCEDCQR